jgi:protein-S-isoprenylcysteine O-methyltransferase Ste14
MRDHPHQPAMNGVPARPAGQDPPEHPGPPGRVRGWPSGFAPKAGWAPFRRALSGAALTPRAERFIRIAVNLAGAVTAALFAQASVRFYLQTHRLIGGLFIIEQAWFAAAFLTRRPPRAVSRRPGAWLAAFGGTFGGLLLRPGGAHPPWGVPAGFALQLVGLLIAITSLAALGRSFGFVAADRGLKTRGPYALVRHPIYASYLLIQSGYVLQSLSVRNVAVVAFATACNVCRALAEERLLARSPAYQAYRQRVRWRLIPCLW